MRSGWGFTGEDGPQPHIHQIQLRLPQEGIIACWTFAASPTWQLYWRGNRRPWASRELLFAASPRPTVTHLPRHEGRKHAARNASIVGGNVAVAMSRKRAARNASIAGGNVTVAMSRSRPRRVPGTRGCCGGPERPTQAAQPPLAVPALHHGQRVSLRAETNWPGTTGPGRPAA